MTELDPVDQAFRLLRADLSEPEPDPALERRLRERFRARPRRRFRPWTVLFTGTLLSGAAFAASGGVDWLRSWWYEVRVDDQVVSGVVTDDGERSFAFGTEDGDSGTVLVRRDHTPDGDARTRIDIASDGPNGSELEKAEDVFGRAVPERFAVGELDLAEPVHLWTDVDGSACTFFAAPDPSSGGSRLLLLREDGSELPVELIARFPVDLLSAEARPEFVERTDGSLAISIVTPDGMAFEFVWNDAHTLRSGVSTLETPDGSVKVHVENAEPRH